MYNSLKIHIQGMTQSFFFFFFGNTTKMSFQVMLTTFYSYPKPLL